MSVYSMQGSGSGILMGGNPRPKKKKADEQARRYTGLNSKPSRAALAATMPKRTASLTPRPHNALSVIKELPGAVAESFKDGSVLHNLNAPVRAYKKHVRPGLEDLTGGDAQIQKDLDKHGIIGGTVKSLARTGKNASRMVSGVAGDYVRAGFGETFPVASSQEASATLRERRTGESQNSAVNNPAPAANPATAMGHPRPASMGPAATADKTIAMMNKRGAGLTKGEEGFVRRETGAGAIEEAKRRIRSRPAGLTFTQKLQATDPEGTKAAQAAHDSGAKLTKRQAQLLGLYTTQNSGDYGTVREEVADTQMVRGHHGAGLTTSRVRNRKRTEGEFLTGLNQHVRDQKTQENAIKLAGAGQSTGLNQEGRVKAMQGMSESLSKDIGGLQTRLDEQSALLGAAGKKERPAIEASILQLQSEIGAAQQQKTGYDDFIKQQVGAGESGGNGAVASQAAFVEQFAAEYGREPTAEELAKAKGKYWA